MTELNPEETPEVVKDEVILPTPGNLIRRPEAFVPPVVEPEPEVVAVEVVVEEPTPEPEPEPVEVEKPKKPTPKAAAKGSELPAIELLAVAFVESKSRKNSQTVAWAQARLAELGYDSARGDLSGWYSSGTAEAVAAFQKDRGLNSEDVVATLEALVAGTKASVF